MPEQEELARHNEHQMLRTVTGESHRWEETARGDQHLEMAHLQETHRRITAEKDEQLQRIISRSGINNWQSIRDRERMQRDHQEQLARQQQLFAELQRENVDLRSVNEKLKHSHHEQELDRESMEFQLEDARQGATDLISQIQKLELELMKRCAFDIIEKHGPLVGLSKFAEQLYAADERAKPAAAGRMLSWLRRMPEWFELHGEGQPGHEQVSLRGSTKRPPTVAGLRAAAHMPGAGPSPPVRQGSDAASVTTNASTKLLMGRAAARRGRTTGDTRRMLNRIVHAPDPDPHRVEPNEFVDVEGRALKEVMRAALRKGKENVAMDGAHREQ